MLALSVTASVAIFTLVLISAAQMSGPFKIPPKQTEMANPLAKQSSFIIPKGSKVQKLAVGHFKFLLQDGHAIEVNNLQRKSIDAIVGDCDIYDRHGKLIASGKRCSIISSPRPAVSSAPSLGVNYMSLEGAVVYLPATVKLQTTETGSQGQESNQLFTTPIPMKKKSPLAGNIGKKAVIEDSGRAVSSDEAQDVPHPGASQQPGMEQPNTATGPVMESGQSDTGEQMADTAPPKNIKKKKNANCYSFEPANSVVSEFKDGWAVMDSTNLTRAIVSFKKERRNDADVALQVIQNYGMNQVCYGHGSFIYYLVSDQSPQGSFPGEQCKTFDPMSATVELLPITSKQNPDKILGSFWAIMDGPNHIWGFNDNESAAREALAIIQQYGFTSICYRGFYYPRK
jgi:hypothetical protein